MPYGKCTREAWEQVFSDGVLQGQDRADDSYSGGKRGLVADYMENFSRRSVCACGEVFFASEPGQKKCSPYCLGTRGGKSTDFEEIKKRMSGWEKEGGQD